jgi:hypothetical protein
MMQHERLKNCLPGNAKKFLKENPFEAAGPPSSSGQKTSARTFWVEP